MEESAPPSPDAKALMRLTAKALQAELRAKALDASGTKAQMVERLLRHRTAQKPSEATGEEVAEEEEATPPVDVPEAPVADGAGDLVEQDTAAEQNSDSTGAHASEGQENPSSPPVPVGETGDDIQIDDAKVEPKERATDSNLPVEESSNGDSAVKQDEEGASAEQTGEDGATSTLRIENFRRPFTLNAVKILLQEFGDFVENGFWMDAIKTHCYVTYESVDVASKTRASLDGKVWPPVSGIALRAAYSQETAMDVHANGESSRPTLKRKATTDSDAPLSPELQKPPPNAQLIKTKTKPEIYYLPLTDEEVRERKARRLNERASSPRSGERGAGRSRRAKRPRKQSRGGYRHVRKL